MKILAFITDQAALSKILDHPDANAPEPRAPPTSTSQ